MKKSLKVTKSKFVTSEIARKSLLKICRRVMSTEEPVYVKDKTGGPFMTLTASQKKLQRPIVGVRAQFFKNKFARFAGLVRIGLCFELKLKNSGKRKVFARAHTSYKDPLEHVIEDWRKAAVKTMTTDQLDQILAKIDSNDRDSSLQEIKEMFEKLMQGVARIAIGHKPFKEGVLDEPNPS